MRRGNTRPNDINVDLRVDWCSYEAAKFAVETWHYSKVMPAGKTVKIGVWENDKFIGVVIFSRGANNNIGSPYGLKQIEVCELVRVALTKHLSQVSQIVSVCIKMLTKQSLGLRLLVSYADPDHGHVGGIYQAMNWVYVGYSEQTGGLEYFVCGKWVHIRTLWARHGTRAINVLDKIYSNSPKRSQPRKLKYLYPLDRAMRKLIAPLAKPYPKRETCVQSVEGDTVGYQPTGEGSIPSARLTPTHIEVT